MELKQGTLLQNGKYRIEKVLGQGSFGITYLAMMKTKVGGNLGNMEATVKVAIKEFFMSDMDGRDGSMVTYSRGNVLHENYKEKFRKESEKLSKLSHRNIVKVLDSFAANNTYYYVMEYCAGGSLDEMIYRRGGLGEAEALAYTKDICLALSYMHSHKMLHLDLKPSNIMLRSSGEAVLIDFGLSKEYDKSGKPETSTTIGLGTKGYAPLEQSNYNKGDSKVFPVTMDVYAMGGTIYKMLTSQTPPEASEILNSGFPVGELKSRGISDGLIEALEQAMSPMVKGRPQSIEKFLSILDGAASDEEVEITVIDDDQGQKPTPKPNRIWKVLMIVMVLIGVIGGYFVVDNIQERKVEEKVLSDKQLYLGYIGEGDELLSDKQYSSAINKYEIAQTYEAMYSATEYAKEFGKGSENKIKAARAAQKSYEAEQARLEQERKEQEAAEQARLEQERKEREAAEQARLEKERKEREQYANTHGSISDHEWVDLGLSVKWATCNVGADSPEDYGYYFAWGETSPKIEYTEENSKTYGKSSYNRDIGGDKSLDAASANWGGSWRLPTKAECKELKNKCKWEWTTQKGVNGYKVTGPNGNSIFLPAAGSRYGSSPSDAGESGDYWSSTPLESNSGRAYILYFNSGSHHVDWYDRSFGRSVRPVSE